MPEGAEGQRRAGVGVGIVTVPKSYQPLPRLEAAIRKKSSRAAVAVAHVETRVRRLAAGKRLDGDHICPRLPDSSCRRILPASAAGC